MKIELILQVQNEQGSQKVYEVKKEGSAIKAVKDYESMLLRQVTHSFEF